MEDQPLPADASPTALSPSYIVDFDPEEDEEDPEEDPVDHPVDGGDNEIQRHLRLEMMTTFNQGMNVEEIEQVVAQRVVNAIEAIAIYETKNNMARKSISQTEREKDKVAENASNKRKWEGNHNGSSSQQNKGHKVPRAHTTRPINNKAYVDLYLCATSANFTIMDCALIKTTEAIEKITRNRERRARIKIEQQLAAVQESQRQDREDFRKRKELVTGQFGQQS
ncbi:hypothetical protein Tco_0033246 [Tanacetum coccineum]